MPAALRRWSQHLALLLPLLPLMAASLDDVQSIAGLGPQIGESVVDYFANPRNREVIRRLQAAGVSVGQVMAALQGANLAAPVGRLTGAREERSNSE